MIARYVVIEILDPRDDQAFGWAPPVVMLGTAGSGSIAAGADTATAEDFIDERNRRRTRRQPVDGVRES